MPFSLKRAPKLYKVQALHNLDLTLKSTFSSCISLFKNKKNFPQSSCIIYISLTKTKSGLTPKQIIGKGMGLHNWLILIKIHSLLQKRSSITRNSLATTYMNKIGILKTRKKSVRF